MRFYIKFSVLFLIILTSCKSRINTENHYAFDTEGILISEYDVFRKGNIDSVNFYIEASGSMNGFFRKNKATEFKKDVWAVISDFPKIDEVFLFKNMTI